MRAIIFFLSLISCFSPSGIAQVYRGAGLDPAKTLSQYNLRNWSRRSDGLPQNSVHAVVQTPDGYLWLGTQEGLARFDGMTFTIFNTRNTPQLKGNYILSLHVSSDGALWIGTRGGGVTSHRNGSFVSVRSSAALERSTISLMYEDRDSTLWLCTPQGLLAVRDDGTSKLYTTLDGLLDNSVTNICEDDRGTLLISSKGGTRILQNERFVDSPLLANVHHPIVNLHRDWAGALWCVTSNGEVWRLIGHQLEKILPEDERTRGNVSCMHADNLGTLWIGTYDRGLSRVASGKFSSFTSNNGLPSNSVLSILEDTESNLWIGTGGSGLTRVSNGRFTTFTLGNSAAQNLVYCVYEDRNGQVLAGNYGGDLMRFENGMFRRALSLPAAIGTRISNIFHDSKGAYWIGTRNGLFKADRGSPVRLTNSDVTAIVEDSKGTIWVGTNDGLGKYVGGEPSKFVAVTSLRSNVIRSVHEDAKGDIWICTLGGGLHRLSNGVMTVFDTKNGFSTSLLLALYEDRDGAFWIGTLGGGLMRFKNNVVHSFTVNDGLFDNNVYQILEDDSLQLWMSCNNGVFHVRKQNLNDFADGKTRTIESTAYGPDDGMLSEQCNGGVQSAGVRSCDGKLWFPTTMGVVVVDPKQTFHSSIAPPVVVERVLIDRVEVPRSSTIQNPPGKGEIEIHYAGLSLSTPKRVTFHTKLEGFDADWVDVGTRRTAFYTNIPPGNYTFHVKAANGDGVWNERGASLVISLAPHFYQTWWFTALCILGAASVALGGHLMYRRQHGRALRTAQLESQLAQARLQLLTMQLHPHFLFNTLNSIHVLIHEDPNLAGATVERLGAFLRLTLESVGVQEVSLAQELDSLDRYVQIELIRFGDRLTVERKVDPNALSALVPNLILQPLVENAIHHGVANRRGLATIQIVAAREHNMLTVHVRDNGGGIHLAERREVRDGVGLSNTKARLHHLYGDDHTFELTALEGGVDAWFTIPFRARPELAVEKG